MLHKLVAEHFVPTDDLCAKEVDHGDGNTLNPAAYNLKWVTASYNIRKAHSMRKFYFLGVLFKGTNKKVIIRKSKHVQ